MNMQSTLKRTHVVTCILLRHDVQPAHMLLLRRSERVGSYQQHWAGVSGFVEAGVSPEEQAFTEIREETSLQREQVQLVRRGEVVEHIDEQLGRHFYIHPFLFNVLAPEQVQTDWEALEMRWIDPLTLSTYATVPKLQEVYEAALHGEVVFERKKSEMDKHTYALDPENPAEMARLTTQDTLVTKGMGGVLPEWGNRLPPYTQDTERTRQVLDVGCGPGSWVLDMAFQFPDVDVAGIDISKIMIDYANARAQTQQLTNASFGIMNVLNPLDFADSAFDLVNMRFAIGFLLRDAWPRVLKELYRVTAPGGYLRCTEVDTFGLTNSPAVEKLLHGIYRVIGKMGYGFSPDGHTFGMTPTLPSLLREAGCVEIQSVAHALDFSSGTELHVSQRENYRTSGLMVKPMLLKTKIFTEEEFEELYEKVLVETGQESFCGVWYVRTVWGKKPAA